MSGRPLLSLIVPTRQRTESLTRLLDSLAATAVCADKFEVVLVVDEDDPASITLDHGGLALVRVVVPPGQTMGALNQAGYEGSSGELVMLLNDDVVAHTPGWDERIAACFAERPDGILLVHVNDTLLRQNLCTFPVVSRTFCELAGEICPREYVRYRIDDHIEDVFNLLHALGQTRTIYLPEVVFEHKNGVLMPQGHREYHSDPTVLALDAPRFEALFAGRKELALRLLDHIDEHARRGRREQQRRELERINDPFSLRVVGRQIVRGKPERQGPTLWQRVSACWRQRGLAGVARALGRRLPGAG